jgi:TPR repeat protein
MLRWRGVCCFMRLSGSGRPKESEVTMTSSQRGNEQDREDLLRNAEQYEESGDFKQAFRCLLTGAQLGDTGCQINLGNFYAKGKGVRRNREEAARWYKKAFKAGERCGALNLAIDMRNAGNTRSAVIWFKKAIAMNDGDACIALAKIYKDRRDKRESAIDLLKQVLPMSCADISDDGKEEAKSLLKEIGMKR